MKHFIVKPAIHYGRGSLKYLEKTHGKRAFIVTDPFMVQLGIVDKITSILDKIPIEYTIFSEIEPDPSLETIKRGLLHIIHTKPDLLIAIGGGSSIDAAKAIMNLCIHTKEQFIESDAIKKPWFIAIPTTSGTGSEVTSYSVVTDKQNNIKIPLSEDNMLPDVAILDEELTLTVPPHVTGDTGLDVFTHSIEAYVSKDATDYTDIFAEKAILLVFEYLLKAYKDGSDLEARYKLHNASCMAGIAFTNASLGINHSLAHALGAKFKLSHGRSNAMFLPHVIAFNAGLEQGRVTNGEVAARYQEISRRIGIPASSPYEGVVALIEGVKTLKAAMNIPHTIQGLNIDPEEYEKAIPEMVASALEDICTKGNPVPVNEAQLTQLYQEAFYGSKLF